MSESKPSIEQCISWLRKQPYWYVMHCLKVLPDTDKNSGEYQLLEICREAYSAIAMWLEYYLLDRADLRDELISTGAIDHKPRAEILVAFYHLAQEVWLRHPEPQFHSPAGWMFLCEMDMLKSFLEVSGFFGDADPMGKAAHYRAFIESVRANCSLELYETWNWERVEYLAEPSEMLLDRARDLATQDDAFEEKYWIPFWKKLKRCSREMRDGKLALPYIDENRNLRYIGKGRLAKPKNKTVKGM